MGNNYGHIVYEEIKSRYIENYGKRGFFYQDYFKNAADGLESFIESLSNYESWLDLTKNPTDDDLDTVWEHKKAVHEAMDEYAQVQAVEFVKWLEQNYYHGQFGYYYNDYQNKIYIPVADLYLKYTDQQK